MDKTSKCDQSIAIIIRNIFDNQPWQL